MANGYWQASPRRRRFILQRYGRGPKKKPPERVKPIENQHNTFKTHRSPVPVDPQRLFRERNYYRNCRCTIFHNNLSFRLPGLLLAGSRRSYRSISNKYYYHSRRYLIHSGPQLPTSAAKISDCTIPASPSYSPSRDIIFVLVALISSMLHKAWRFSSMLLWPPSFHTLTSPLTSSTPPLTSPSIASGLFTPPNTSLMGKVSTNSFINGCIHAFLCFQAINIRDFNSSLSFHQPPNLFKPLPSIQRMPSPSSEPSNVSEDLLAPTQRFLIDFDGISIQSKPFYTRSSSIADDTTTLCPTIPHSIEFKSLDDVTVSSSPSIFGN